METWFGMVAHYSRCPPPSSGLIAAIRDAEGCPVGVLKFQKNEGDEWLAALYDQEGGDIVALSSIDFYYQNGHLADVNTSAPVWVNVDEAIVEQAREFLVNDGPKPVWWRENPQ